jgi:hypothetical protein
MDLSVTQLHRYNSHLQYTGIALYKCATTCTWYGVYKYDYNYNCRFLMSFYIRENVFFDGCTTYLSGRRSHDPIIRESVSLVPVFANSVFNTRKQSFNFIIELPEQHKGRSTLLKNPISVECMPLEIFVLRWYASRFR